VHEDGGDREGGLAAMRSIRFVMLGAGLLLAASCSSPALGSEMGPTLSTPSLFSYVPPKMQYSTWTQAYLDEWNRSVIDPAALSNWLGTAVGYMKFELQVGR
jgi:hypothetical protein